MLLDPHKNKIEFILLIALMMALNSIAVDIMLPALPIIANDLGATSENDLQLVLTLYLAGFGFSLLIYGPLSDSIGRKPVVFIGTTLFLISVALAPLSPDFTYLLLLRFIQGLGAGASRVVANAIVRDSYEGRTMAQIMSLVMMVFMAMPIIAPSFGQVIIMLTTWHSTFLFMAVMAIVMLVWVCFRLPETLSTQHKKPLSFKSIISSFALVFTTRQAMAMTFANMLLLGTLFGFLGISPLVYIDIYELGPLYPLMIALTATNLAIASFVNSRLLNHFRADQIAFVATIGFIICALIWSLLAWQIETLPLWLFVAVHQPIMLCFGFAGVNQFSSAMQPLGSVAGTASSVIGFIRTTGGAAVGAAIGYFFDGTILPLTLGFLYCGVGAAGFMLLARPAFRPLSKPV
ncbi:multidrug effflux MFS transporter [Maritalea porphyrae]|uniref:multidrug effflux MFS transporter n=1 Tax=Maritalea porphyrae TaxID=880732 RepID=UPI0022AF82F1|nr:multidrug effflux MFS transporter [Maritalea porphyrae]MCZ4272746.1 multidrug effflux MFS transporter [Maritalea porphyrae]